MKNKISGLLAIGAVLTGIYGFSGSLNQPSGIEEVWNGTISYTYSFLSSGRTQDGEYSYTWSFQSNTTFEIDLVNDKATGKITYDLLNNEKRVFPNGNSSGIDITKVYENGDGTGEVELSVEVENDNGTYWIKTLGPEYTTNREYKYWSSILESVGQNQPADISIRTDEAPPVTVADQKIGKDPKKLVGQTTEKLVADNGAVYLTIISWNLVKGPPQKSTVLTNKTQGVELIVTPENYSGLSTSIGANSGNEIKISFHVQGNGGRDSLLTRKVVRFDLELINTGFIFNTKQNVISDSITSIKNNIQSDSITSVNRSIQPNSVSSIKPGIQADSITAIKNNIQSDSITSMFAYRFMDQAGAIVSQYGQKISIPGRDGVNGFVVVGSFDNIPGTMLKAEAILDDGTRLKGRLYNSPGVQRIPIPK